MNGPDIQIVPTIPITLPWKRIYARMGYRSGNTSMSDEQRKFIDRSVQDGYDLCSFKGAWITVPVTGISETDIILETGEVLKSSQAALMLKGSDRAVFLAATAGREIVRAVEEKMKQGESSTAVIYDAVGSECADAALGWVHKFIVRTLPRRGMACTTRRFSPGYGDMALEEQKKIYDILDLKKLDIDITPTYILVPEKSVCAIAGARKTS